MIYCDNSSCDFCKKEHTGKLICATEPRLLGTHESLDNHCIICATYRDRGNPIVQEFHPGKNKKGLFPGQIGYRRDDDSI